MICCLARDREFSSEDAELLGAVAHHLVDARPAYFEQVLKYLVMGKLEEMPDPELVMIITDPQRVMRLCKAYTWKTGELVHAFGGTNWSTDVAPPHPVVGLTTIGVTKEIIRTSLPSTLRPREASARKNRWKKRSRPSGPSGVLALATVT